MIIASRIVDYDHWQVSPSVFSILDNTWGPHTVDRFASPSNAQLGRLIASFGAQEQRQWIFLL